MFGTHDLPLFALSVLLLAITPGPDTLYIVGRSSAHGGKWGTMAALGVGVGIFVHIFAAAVGLSAVLAASATAFAVIKLIGAGYLIYIGITLLLFRSSAPKANVAAPARISLRRVFAEGFLTNVLNPKVALFFLAFIPQFIDAQAPNKALAFVFLGMVCNVIGTLWNLFTAWYAARVGDGIKRDNVRAWLNRGIGAMFVLIGARLALTKLG
jgi:threonine/homoserine/homoserine lactone efflux protein